MSIEEMDDVHRLLLQVGPVPWPALSRIGATQRLRQIDVTSMCHLLRPRYVLGRLHVFLSRLNLHARVIVIMLLSFWTSLPL